MGEPVWTVTHQDGRVVAESLEAESAERAVVVMSIQVGCPATELAATPYVNPYRREAADGR